MPVRHTSCHQSRSRCWLGLTNAKNSAAQDADDDDGRAMMRCTHLLQMSQWLYALYRNRTL